MVAAAAATVVACSGGGVVPPGTTGPPPVSLDDLPACDPPDPPASALDGGGMELPPGAYLTVVERDGPLTTANGWAPMTPVELRAYYEDPPPGWTPLTVEDEIVEAEVLLSSETTRLFVQAIAACPDGSDLYIRAIPEAAVG